MISLHLSINNPWAKENFKNLFCRSGPITKHMAWEFEITRHNYTLAEFSTRYTVKQDHAGFNLELGLFGYSMHFQIYDGRHWDYTNNCWEVYED
jgi:hypothetical protein